LQRIVSVFLAAMLSKSGPQHFPLRFLGDSVDTNGLQLDSSAD